MPDNNTDWTFHSEDKIKPPSRYNTYHSWLTIELCICPDIGNHIFHCPSTLTYFFLQLQYNMKHLLVIENNIHWVNVCHYLMRVWVPTYVNSIRFHSSLVDWISYFISRIIAYKKLNKRFYSKTSICFDFLMKFKYSNVLFHL